MIFFAAAAIIFSPAATLPVMLTIATFGLPASSPANGFSAAKHKVKDPFRQPNLMDNLGKGDGIIGRKFAGLNDNGISSDESRRQLAGDKKEREVPRQDPRWSPPARV